VPQAEAVNDFLAEKGQEISVLLSLVVDDEEIVKRLLLRGKSSGRSDDNDEKIIRNRIEVYKKETTPVFDFYNKSGKSLKIKGVGSIEEIFDRLCEEVDKVC
jgi:adenylate kinase